ncbi:MAG: nucleoside phosphorylase [Micrococcales bacterium]|nr:nucleoside phosphorylase [Micrococcales bacterium]
MDAIGKDYGAESVFRPGNLLREARRQRNLPDQPVPRVCLLDPDGDIATYLAESGGGRRHAGWACYHTDMWVTDLDGTTVGVVGRAVGAPFAVLVAEQMFASGADLVVSITSAGQLQTLPKTPCFVLIDKALRDEGTSLHYLPPEPWSVLAGHLEAELEPVMHDWPEPVIAARSWTTDAPYRETKAAIDAAVEAGATCVEMEAAALYALAGARGYDIVCLAHITNTMAITENDFEKGEANGVHAALVLTTHIARTILAKSRALPRTAMPDGPPNVG